MDPRLFFLCSGSDKRLKIVASLGWGEREGLTLNDRLSCAAGEGGAESRQ